MSQETLVALERFDKDIVELDGRINNRKVKSQKAQSDIDHLMSRLDALEGKNTLLEEWVHNQDKLVHKLMNQVSLLEGCICCCNKEGSRGRPIVIEDMRTWSMCQTRNLSGSMMHLWSLPCWTMESCVLSLRRTARRRTRVLLSLHVVSWAIVDLNWHPSIPLLPPLRHQRTPRLSPSPPCAFLPSRRVLPRRPEL